MYFCVNDLQNNECKEYFTEPQIVGTYCFDGNRCYHSDLSQLKYYKEPRNLNNVDFNLDDNLNTIQKLDNINKKIDYLLKWISENFNHLQMERSKNRRWLEPEFVCYRGVLSNLLATPFDSRDGWIICASKFKGTIYLCGFDTDKKKRYEINKNEFHKRCTSWGYKFEQYLVSDSPSENPDLSKPLNQNEEFCCVFKSRLGNNILLYGAEVDAVCSEHPIQDTLIGKKVELVEMKTMHHNALNLYKNSIASYRAHRTLKWWVQSYLVGIDKIICGLRDNNGIVHSIQKFNLNKLVKDSKHDWNPEGCTSFCTGLLERMKAVISQNYDKCLYKFTYIPGKNTITVEELKPTPDLEYVFLHPWYITKANQYFEK
ncbi:PREDICTED: decapping and exoribonuclease protein-like [Dufourea novaeangliae]|uniref:Decapping nuclease n=1 Tax=Dufourea novaeangliae TaxID=178035 RepID=A0A154PGP8_DUFNO|nr:PREDICTED: decapping and exoribonuclease protein-like [Dufourea novaeangliae]KZC11031.1 Protein Dom3Z [Dufourea novaeangliae]